MNRAQLVLAAAAATFVGGCAQSRHHHYAPYEGNRKWFRNVEPAVARADQVGFRVVPPSAEYALTSCVVSGAPLRPWIGASPPFMDGPMALVYQGTEVQLYCSACLADFRGDPEKYVAKVRAGRT